MQTTAIFIEPLITGLIVLAVLIIPFNSIDSILDKLGEMKLEKGAILLVIAYILGILFDRFGDSLVGRAEHRRRLEQAKKFHRYSSQDASKDVFPEASIRARSHFEDDGGVAWFSYLRTRIRIARSVAVFGPALTLSLLVSQGSGMMVTGTLVTVTVIYIAAFVWVQILERVKRYSLPRTDSVDLARVGSVGFTPFIEPNLYFFLALELVGVILVCSIGKSFPGKCPSLLAVLLIGNFLTALAFWAWWRILRTYYNFMYRLGIVQKDSGETGQATASG